MAQAELCQVCRKNEASVNCFQCGKPLCASCKKDYYHQEAGPWCRTLGEQLSQIWSGDVAYPTCPDCFPNIELSDVHAPPWLKS